MFERILVRVRKQVLGLSISTGFIISSKPFVDEIERFGGFPM